MGVYEHPLHRPRWVMHSPGARSMPSDARSACQMTETAIKPSSRLQRAAEAELQDLCKQHERLSSRRDRMIRDLRELERSISDVEDRMALVSQVAPSARIAPRGVLAARAGEDLSQERILRGPAIRETAVRVLLNRGGIDAVHYREWFEFVREAGYSVAGKDGLAVFLTQISRSPVVRKTTQSGVYELDRRAPQRLRQELEILQREMRELTGRASTGDLSEIRARRERLSTAIGKVERALEEAQRVLAVEGTHSRPLEATG